MKERFHGEKCVGIGVKSQDRIKNVLVETTEAWLGKTP
jgi:hypothetical protein